MTADRTVRYGDGSRGAVATLVAVRGAAADLDDDLELCMMDFARFGLTGLEALGELLSVRAGIPIVIAARKPAAKPETSAVRCILRKAGDPDEFRAIVRRLCRTGGAMHLRLDI